MEPIGLGYEFGGETMHTITQHYRLRGRVTSLGLVLGVSLLLAAPDGQPRSPEVLDPGSIRLAQDWPWLLAAEGEEDCGPKCTSAPRPVLVASYEPHTELAALELPAKQVQVEQVISALSAQDGGETGPESAQEPQEVASQRRDGKLRREQVEAWVHELAPEYELDPTLVLEVIAIESRFNPAARSPKSAQGLMQLMPATAARFGVEDASDPVQNLRGGMAYLRWLLIRFEGDLRLALAGYNAGEGAVRRFDGIPPYGETQRYVERITRAYGKTLHPIPTA